jgi:hypothetical protein
MKDGPKSGCIFIINQPANQPASQPTDLLSYKIFKLEYLSNYLLDLTQILNLSIWDQTKIENCLKQRVPQMEDNLKILKMEYFSNLLSDLPQILKLTLWDQTEIDRNQAALNRRRPQNIKIRISQQPIIRCSSNSKLWEQTKIENCLK